MDYPIIPNTIVIHLGRPDQDAENVTENFSDYIKNVASSEIYPTWPKESLIANILAQISVAMNRVYTEYYRSRGYDFDITSTPANDQKYVYQRDIYQNIAGIVDEIFNSYIRKIGRIEPLFAKFCDGVNVTCDGLSQWGTVALANNGLSYLDILKSYYGNDIEIVKNVPVGSVEASAPPVTLREGEAGRDVELIQRRLNRISSNFPGIPKIYPADGFYGSSTTQAVKRFEEVFGYEVTGEVSPTNWYRIESVYSAVKNLSELYSEGISLSDISTQFVADLREGMDSVGVVVLQYYLNYIGSYLPTVPTVKVDGSFGPLTKDAVIAFQRTYGLPETGIVDRAVWDKMQNVYYGLVSDIPYVYVAGEIKPYPGRILRIGIDGDDVRVLQSYLNYISDRNPVISKVEVDGIYGTQTEKAVRTFQEFYGLPVKTGRVNTLTWNAIVSVYEDFYSGSLATDKQYPGYVIS